jgi:hypothetical protein
VIEIIWELVVKEDARAAFALAYSGHGEWAFLFRRYSGYLGSTLLEDTSNPHRFVTIDRWSTREQYAAMRVGARDEYARLDAQFAEWTVDEREIGTFVNADASEGATDLDPRRSS